MTQLREYMINKKIEISIGLCFVLPPIGMLLLTIMSCSTIFHIIKSRKPLARSLFSTFLLSLLVATLGAIVIKHNIMVVAGSLIILIYWGVYQTIVTSNRTFKFEQFRWIIILVGLYNCIIFPINRWVIDYPITGFLTGTALIGDTVTPEYERLIGSGYNPNFTVVMILLGVAFILAELLIQIQKKQYSYSMLLVSILLILCAGVIGTGSRAGFITMICLFALFVLRISKKIFILLTIGAVICIEPLIRLVPRHTSIGNSYIGRQEIWEHAIIIWKQSPLFGTTQLGFRQEYMSMFKYYLPHSHNIFIGFLVEYGLIGGVALVILVSITLYKCIQLLVHHWGNKGVINYFTFSFPIIILTGILDEPVYSPQIAILFIVIMSFWERYLSRIKSVSMSVTYISLSEVKFRIPYNRVPLERPVWIDTILRVLPFVMVIIISTFILRGLFIG